MYFLTETFIYSNVYNRFSMMIADSSSLILLTKARLLDNVATMNLCIPQQVYEEVVVEGFKRGFSDAILIDTFIKNRTIIIKKVTHHKEFPLTLGKGEKGVLELYYQEKADTIIIDDKKVITLCKLLLIPYMTVHMVIIDLLNKKNITKSETTNALKIIAQEGRYSSEIIIYYYHKINEVKDNARINNTQNRA